MTKVLWIAEKKSLAMAIAAVLPGAPESDWEAKGLLYNRVGDNWLVWFDGHAFEQAMPDTYLPDDVPTTGRGNKVWRRIDLPIVPKKWQIQVKDAKRARVQKTVELLKACDVVHHAGDPDAEGQLIVDEALLYLGNTKPVRRVLINDYNETKVREAIANIRDNHEDLFQGWSRWALARSRYDWLFGLNLTRGLTLRGRELGYDGLLAVGSVQSPLQYIVRERDRAIEEFKPIPYFSLAAHFQHPRGAFKARWKPQEDQAGLDESGRLVDAGIASSLTQGLTGKQAKIEGFSQEQKKQQPPLPLSMNELSMDGFSRFGYSSQEVLDAAQVLYDTYKVATYPRSDNRYLSEAQHLEAPAILEAIFRLRPDLAQLSSLLDATRKSPAFDDRKMEGTPHHGVVPTIPEKPVDMATWTEAERNVYDLIVRSYLCQFANPYIYKQTSIEVDVAGEAFVASGRTPVDQGWKAIYQEPEEEGAAGDNESEQILPVVAENDQVACDRCTAASKKTTPPPRFDDRLLTDAMMNLHKYVQDDALRQRLKEGEGIGTTATRPGIVQGMKDNGILIPVKAGSSKLMTSPAARAAIDAQPLEIKTPVQAALFKSRLDIVAAGGASIEDFEAETVVFIKSALDAISSASMRFPNTHECPRCQGGILRRREGDHGPFWYCSHWSADPKCDARFRDINGEPDLAPPVQCPKCAAGQLRRSAKPGKTPIWYCSRWNADPKCDAKFHDAGGRPNLNPPAACPSCKQGQLVRMRSGTRWIWVCSRFKAGCKTTLADRAGAPLLAT